MATDQKVGGSNPLAHVVKRKGDAKSISLFFSEAKRKIRTRFVSPLRSGRRKAKVHWTLCVLRFAPVGAEPRSTGPCAPSSARFCFESRKPLFIKASGFFHALRIRIVLWSTVVHLYRARFKSELTRTGSLPIEFDYCRDFYAIKGTYYAIRTKTCYRIFSPNMIK